MKQCLTAVLLLSSVLLSIQLSASERPDHYKGKAADTLQQAVANFSEYNQKLNTLLQGELTPLAMAEIHQLTYTLEVALEKIHSETGKLKDTLEQLHIASERMDTATAKQSGDNYIKTAQTLVK